MLVCCQLLGLEGDQVKKYSQVKESSELNFKLEMEKEAKTYGVILHVTQLTDLCAVLLWFRIKMQWQGGGEGGGEQIFIDTGINEYLFPPPPPPPHFYHVLLVGINILFLQLE